MTQQAATRTRRSDGRLSETVSTHAIAAALVGGTTAFVDDLAGPVFGPFIDLGAEAVNAGIAAHAALRITRHARERRAVSHVLREALPRVQANGSALGATLGLLRLGCGLQGIAPTVAGNTMHLAKKTATSFATSAAKLALTPVPGAAMLWRTVKAATAATRAFWLVTAIEHESRTACAPKLQVAPARA